jgi:hypothetical protein
MKTTKKPFDCVAMKRRGARHVYELTKNMTRPQELAFWRAEEAKLLPARRRARRSGAKTRT